MFEGDVVQLGESSEFPSVVTSEPLTDHFHPWTKHNRVNTVNQPEILVEISEVQQRQY
jgi:formate dehydrogenase major subunit